MAGFIGAAAVDVDGLAGGCQLRHGLGVRRGQPAPRIGVPASQTAGSEFQFLFSGARDGERIDGRKSWARAAARRAAARIRLNTPSAAHRIEEARGTTRWAAFWKW